MMLRDALLRDGYAIIPNVFSADELAYYRAVIDRHFARGGNIFKLGKTQPNAAVMVPGLAPIFHDPRIVSLFRQALGSDDVLFTGHCDIHRGMFSGWHKDTGPSHGYFDDDCFAGACNVYKIGIYLQDHQEADGLTVVPGSHLDREIDERDAVTLRTRAGDAVIFDVRITHRGKTSDRLDKLLHRANQALKILAAKARGRAPAKDDFVWAYELRRQYDALTGRRDRHSIFFTYGLDEPLTAQFAAANMVRQSSQNRELGKFPSSLVEGLRQEKVRLPDVLAQFT